MFAVVILGVALSLLAALVVLLVRYIPNDKVGVVEKRWSAKGSLKSGIIALEGEAGYQPDLLRGGVHFLNRLQYAIHTVPLVTIPQGRIGYVFARDGRPLDAKETLASNTHAGDFQSVRGFLAAGGQRGPQRKILREGAYAINVAQFVVIAEDRVYHLAVDAQEDALFRRMSEMIAARQGFTAIVIKGTDDQVGIVTVHDGPSLPQGEIIAPTREGHDSFQDPDAFLSVGGLRGRQLEVLVEGTYYLNRLFATVELVPKTVIDVGNVGVVVSYTGELGLDLSGVDYKHGELAKKGGRGVWNDPLLPGKYAFNTCAGKVEKVPTTNIILKWLKSETGAHRLDENLSEISLITKDAFEPSLPLSVVVHIDYRKAPLVVQRFGDIKRLVEQTLDPMVAAYFKNVGQTRTLIELIQDRARIQDIAREEMREKFSHYNLELEEVLIGTPASSGGGSHIETLLAQLRARQIAAEQVETYVRQQHAAEQERTYREAEARAKQQGRLTESEVAIVVESNQGKAEYQRAVQQAEQIRVLANAEADRTRSLASADAERAVKVGLAEAQAIEAQVSAYGGPKFQLTEKVMTRFAQAIETAHVDVVPRVVVGGSGTSGHGLIENLMGVMLAEKLDLSVSKAEVQQIDAQPAAR